MTVTVHNEHAKLRVNKRRIARHVRQVLTALGRSRAGVDVTLTDDHAIRRLNAEYRTIDEVTDVLSFAIADDPDDPGVFDHLGDVVVSLDTAARQALTVRQVAASGGYMLREETLFLVTHGVLHLLGYDHVEDGDAEVMQALELRFMKEVTAIDPQQVDRQDHGL